MTELLPPGGWIILAGALTAVACALVGSFLVLRRMAMLGDAISHAVLPGIVLAFLFTGSRSSPAILVGAGAVGVLTAFLVEFLHKKGRLQADASIGVTFTWLFALGVILVSALAGQVDLDQDCVLYGEIAYVPWDTWSWNGVDVGPRPVWLLFGLVLVMLAFVLLGWSRLKIVSFDPELAAAVGIPVGVWHYLLMGAVSMTTVASFEIVGAILVVAMLVAPAATAYLLTDRLGRMIALAAAFGVASAAGGYALATWLNASIAGAMGVVTGLFYFTALVFAPRHGLLARRRSARLLPGAAALAALALLVALVGAPAAAFGHDAPLRPLSTDRPDRTESPYTVDAGHVQLEMDAASLADDDADGVDARTIGLAAMNWKYGLSSRLDVQFVIPLYVRERIRVSMPGGGVEATERVDEGIGDVTLRLKWNAWGNDGGPTAFGVMPYLTVPTADDAGDDVVAGLILPLAVDLRPGWGLGTMLQLDWLPDADGDGRHVDVVLSSAVGRDLTDALGAFVELFLVASPEAGGSATATGNAGITLAAGPNVQFDAGVNLGLTESADDRVLFLGLTLRR
jgi:manganese/zinc/iron transport system permease protein